MNSIFVYQNYDLIKEMNELNNDISGTWETEAQRYRKKIKEMIDILENSVDVMIKEVEIK